MSSPAELLSMQHAPATDDVTPVVETTSESPISVTTSANGPTTESTEITSDENVEESDLTQKRKVININDDKLFPSLVGTTASASWNTQPATSWSKPVSPSYKPIVKSTSTQVTFIIDDEQQQNLAKGELFKIFGNIQSELNVKVESTYSSASKKRTFLLNGPVDKVAQAKRELIRQLTKPTKITFDVPSKLRSVIIGPMGKNLKPIIEQTSVRIDISRPTEDNNNELLTEDEALFGKSVTVTIEGDIQGCSEAKAKILQIVNENTRNLTIKIPVTSKVKPFVAGSIAKIEFPKGVDVIAPEPNSRISTIMVSGPREDVILARDEIRSLLLTLENDIVIDEREVPKHLHSFLNAETIFSETNVVIEVPSPDSVESKVRFVGTKADIAKAVTLAKKLTSNYFVDTLDLSKSHGGNYLHAKSITAYFTYTKYFEALSTEFNVTVTGPSYHNLSDTNSKNVVISFSSSVDNKDAIKKARKELVDSVNKITPNFIRVVSDIESFVFPKIDTSIADENDVAIVPLGHLSNSGNSLILIATQADEEFLPSAEQIQERLDLADKSLNNLRDLSNDLTSVVIELDSEDQKRLESGNTLKVLLNKYEPNALEIKLHQNADGHSENEVYFRGFKKEVERAAEDISKVIEDIKNYEEASKYNTTIEFPTKFLARLIGQKGSFVNDLMEEFNVKIDVFNDDSSQSEISEIKLTGLQSNVDECIKKINTLSKRWADEKTSTFSIDPKFRRNLIGANGVYAQRLQEKYNVKIQFPDASDKSGSVVIRGPSRGVAKAEEEIKQLLEYEKEHSHSDTTVVPIEALAIVIGKNGENLKDLCAEFDVKIHSRTNQEDAKASGKATFEIVGSKSGIKEAKAKIDEISTRIANTITKTIEVNPKWYKNLIGPNGMTMRDIVIKAGGSVDDRNFRRYIQFPSRNSDSNLIVCEGDNKVVTKIIKIITDMVKDLESYTSKTVEIPKKQHRLIIGSGGSIRRGIEDEFKVRLIIPKQDVESDEVTVKGKPEDIEKAIAKIQELTAAK
ncbi:hypothetical protein CANINC_004668 [Pichia inconspicua]|uniref:K Homology domain-containing protein n=1 Tax=Pichia inconspicua TaxID=52247 RepID=A0A4T0WVX3_9ASCO|nr:hypothetical protein CANINC_004668 [[Candida] inconspicua]